MSRVFKIDGGGAAGPSCWPFQIHLKWQSAQRSRPTTGQGGRLSMLAALPSLPLTPSKVARFLRRQTTHSSSLVTVTILLKGGSSGVVFCMATVLDQISCNSFLVFTLSQYPLHTHMCTQMYPRYCQVHRVSITVTAQNCLCLVHFDTSCTTPRWTDTMNSTDRLSECGHQRWVSSSTSSCIQGRCQGGLAPLPSLVKAAFPEWCTQNQSHIALFAA